MMIEDISHLIEVTLDVQDLRGEGHRQEAPMRKGHLIMRLKRIESMKTLFLLVTCRTTRNGMRLRTTLQVQVPS